MKKTASFTVSVLFKKKGAEWIGHCLELDIVQTNTNLAKLKSEMRDLVVAQVTYAFKNNNLDYLFHPAPQEVWKEFFDCKEMDETKYKLEVPKKRTSSVPPWIIANVCKLNPTSYAA